VAPQERRQRQGLSGAQKIFDVVVVVVVLFCCCFLRGKTKGKKKKEEEILLHINSDSHSGP